MFSLLKKYEIHLKITDTGIELYAFMAKLDGCVCARRFVVRAAGHFKPLAEENYHELWII